MKLLRWSLLLLIVCLPGQTFAQVNHEPVRRDTLHETVSLDGVIEAVQQSTVSAQTSGTVLRLPFDVDDSVEAGELIVQLEDSEQQARLNQARGRLEEAESNFENARRQFARIEEVHDEGFVSQQDFDQARNNLSTARARLESARAAVEEAEKELEYTRVVAPYSGILTDRHVEVGESVRPGQPLMSGLSLEQLRVVVELPQKYASRVRDTRQARITFDDGRVLESGEMTFYPYADPETHTFRLRLALNEPESSLFPGMLVKVGVPASERSALWIPASSLIQRSELRAVYVVEDDTKPRLRQIRTGVRDNGRIEVLAGLSEGEQVVTNPAGLVEAGRQIEAENPDLSDRESIQ